MLQSSQICESPPYVDMDMNEANKQFQQEKELPKRTAKTATKTK